MLLKSDLDVQQTVLWLWVSEVRLCLDMPIFPTRVTGLRDFLSIGQLLKVWVIFLRCKIAQKFLHFDRVISSWKLVRFRFQKWFGVDVLDFQIELWYRYFGIFWLGNCFGHFFAKISQIYFSIIWSHCFLFLLLQYQEEKFCLPSLFLNSHPSGPNFTKLFTSFIYECLK